MRSSWRRVRLAVAVAVTGGLALGALTTPAQAQKRGGTLTIVRPTDPVSLDPHLETTAPGAWVYYNLLEPLLTLDEKMQVQLKLAAKYEVVSPTKVRWLRPGAKQTPPTGWNTSRYANPRVDTLLDQGRRSLNQGERERAYAEVQDILAKEMVWIPVYNTKEIIVTRASVKGFVIHPVE